VYTHLFQSIVTEDIRLLVRCEGAILEDKLPVHTNSENFMEEIEASETDIWGYYTITFDY
jgi:hypothetical protein